MDHELLDIVNDQDEVIGQATRAELYEKKFTGRIVHVFVLNSKGEIALQMRSRHMSFLPGHWTSSAGGHVKHGETYAEAAQRELGEELGIAIPVQEAQLTWYELPELRLRRRIGIYFAKYDGSLKINTREVQRIGWFTPQQIFKMAQAGEPMQPEFVDMLRLWRQKKSNNQTPSTNENPKSQIST